MTISGSYRLLSVDNPAADLKAIFNNNISQADIDLLTAPDSKVDNVMCMNGNALSIDLKYSAKPDWNTSLNYVIGVKKDLPAPFPGNSVVVMCGENAMCETVTFPNAVYTYNFSFSSFGVTVKTASAKAGYISTQIWERIDVPLTGFYIMESNENMVKMVMADVPNMTEAAAKQMASYHALRVRRMVFIPWSTTLAMAVRRHFTSSWEKSVRICPGTLEEEGPTSSHRPRPESTAMSTRQRMARLRYGKVWSLMLV